MTLTTKRARYLLDNMGACSSLPYAFHARGEYSGKELDPNGITEAEDKHIREVWRVMPGHTSYLDALKVIASGVLSKGEA